MMRKLFFLMCIVMAVNSTAVNAQVGPDITSWIENTTLTGYGGYISNIQLVQYSATEVYVSTNCIPLYAIGPWPSNPNVPSPQNFVCEFPRHPVQNTGAATAVGLGTIGLWSNGVSIYNPEDGFHWSGSAWAMGPGPQWNRNALIFEGVSFDSCLGHPAPGGDYHNHVNPKCLYNDADSTHHSPIIGYAFDGFPIYGAYGYASPMTPGAIKRMKSSYVLSTAASRAAGGPPVSTYPMGDCVDDFIYTAGSGDLDAHNGRNCVTPEYPGGTYAYFVTINNSLKPAYPFVLGPTFYGVAGSVNTHVIPVGTDTTYTPSYLGANQVSNKTIKYIIAPNPVADYAYIYMDAGNVNNVTATLYDMNGRALRALYDLQPSIAYAMDMMDIPAGMYVLKFVSGEMVVSEKIVK